MPKSVWIYEELCNDFSRHSTKHIISVPANGKTEAEVDNLYNITIELLGLKKNALQE